MTVPSRVAVAPRLPDGWLPEGAAVHVLAKREPHGAWEAVVPEFSVAGMGESAEAAAINALELLEDYLFLCSREGKTFDEALRPVSRRSALPMMRNMLALLVGETIGRDGRRGERYRIPLRLIGAN